MKISVVGAGNAGCFTALHYAFYTRNHPDIEINLIHNPDVSPEKVGQATVLDPPNLLFGSLGFDWFNNKVHATPKTGILYEGWGKLNDKVFHPFPADSMGMHFCPWQMQEHILNSGVFKVSEDDVDPKDVDADYVFDCRGKPNDFSDYDELKNPLNACILGKPNWRVEENLWSRHVATPDGWTFVIPSHSESPSRVGAVGYLYNSDITSKEVAQSNFLELFDVEVTAHLNFSNYVAQNPIVDERIFLNGNRLFFVEPMEAGALQAYLEWARYSFDAIMNQRTKEDAVKGIKTYIQRLQNFILWHYQFGSKYDTPFWDYAKTLTFDDEYFNVILNGSREMNWENIMPSKYGGMVDANYSYWQPLSFKYWDDGMTRQVEE